MRIVAVAVGALALIGLALALVVPALMDWSRFREPLVARLEVATGRRVALSGPIAVRLLPSPALSAQGLSIANPDGTEGAFAEVERLRVTIAPLPLLIGQVRITALELDQPRLHLARLANGRPNWVFGTAAAEESVAEPPAETGYRAPKIAPPAAAPSETADALPVHEILVSNGSLTYADEAGQRVAVTELVGKVLLGGRSGPFQANGAAKIGGALISFDGVVERLGTGRASPVNLALRMPGDDAKLVFQGMVTQLSGGETLRGHLALSAPDPRRTLSRLGTEPALPAGELQMEADLSLSAQEMSAANLVATLGEARATGSVTAALGDVPQVDAQLKVAALDLDKWRNASGAKTSIAAAPSAAQGAASAPGEAQAPAGNFSLPTGLFVSAAVSVEALSWHGQVAREAKLEAVLDQGEVMVRTLSAQLPGNSNLAAEGTLAARDGRAAFDGSLFLRSDNLRTLLAWTGTDPGTIPEARLRTIDLSSPVRLAWPELSLPDFRLTLDSSHARGGLTARLGGRPAFGLSANIDSINLDAYRPAPQNVAKAAPSDAVQAEASPATTPVKADAGFDADVTLKVKTLITHGIAVDDIAASALLQSGVLEVRQLSGSVAGTQASAQGRLAGVTEGTARLERMAVRLDSAQPAKLFRALGVDGPKLASLHASGAVSGDVTGTVFEIADLAVQAGPSALTGQGRLDMSGAKPRITADLAAKELALDALMSDQRSGMLLPGGPRLPPFALPPGASATPVAAGAVGLGNSPFSREPLDLSGLQRFDARLDLKADLVTAKGWRLEHAVARMEVQDGTASLDSLTGSLLGGALSVSAKLGAAPEPALSGGLKVDGADLAAAPITLGGGFAVTQGKLATEGRFTTSGRSTQDMAARLNGDGSVSVKDGVLEGFDLPAVNQRLSNMENLGSLLGVAQAGLAGGKTPFSQLAGTWRAENGVIASRDLKLDAQGGGADAQTSVDLPRWSTITHVNFHLANAAQAPLGLRLEGPLDNPRKIIDVNALQRHLVSEGLGRALKNKGDEQQQADQPREKNTGKNILKNLFKSLGGQ